jgi:serine/threonine protein kinase
LVDVSVRDEVALKRCPVCSSSVPQGAAHCPTCGASLDGTGSSGRTDQALRDVLPAGTQLNHGGFSVGRVLGRGGFGITYLGADLRLKRAVAIKEFFPAGSTRQGTCVMVPSTLSRADYDLARQKFLQEARLLARFRHPSIVNVYEVFEENNTAYMVMEYLQGENLLERMERSGGPLDEAELVALAGPVAEALNEVHAAGVLHRDIKPENIMLVGADGSPRPVLIDFGAAREFASGMANRHSIVLTPGYAPLEQYSEEARRGPFTDVYALAATLYHVATGQQPPAATERALGVALKSPRTLNSALGPAFDAAIMHGMEMKVDARPQSAHEFAIELSGDRHAPDTALAPPSAPAAFEAAPAPPQIPSPPAPSPALPATGRHIDRVRQIARELGSMSPIQTDRFRCPVCRAADMLDAARTIEGTRCPVCRSAVLEERFSAADLLLCPSCSSGRWQPVNLARIRPDALLRCPACARGSVLSYVRSQLLFIPDLWARCDYCGADFDYHAQDDSLTLSELPGGAGRLSADWIGQTRSRREWAAMLGDDAGGFHCPLCASDFHSCGAGKLTWATRSGDPDQVPETYRGQCLSRGAWAKVAHHLSTSEGTVTCPSCAAQFDEPEPGQLTLLTAARDPHGVLATYRGRTAPAATWRALATGRRPSSVPTLVCPSCTTEIEESTGGNSDTLVWYDPAHDPFATGRRYQGRQLSPDDWRRVAAGGVPRAEDERLREEAHQEFWAGMLAGEISTSTAEESFPDVKAAGEKIVITFAALQMRSRFGFLYERDSGQLWLTTRRVYYQGEKDTVSFRLAEAGSPELVDDGRGSLLVEIQYGDRRREFRFIMGTGPIAFDVDGLALQLPWDEGAFIELFESLRRQA